MSEHFQNIGVIGAGAWGTALAQTLAHAGRDVTLWAFEDHVATDINTMHELWGVSTYRKQNKYLSTTCIMDLIDGLPNDCAQKSELQATSKRLIEMYDKLSLQYHTEKVSNSNNSLVLG